MAHNGRGSSIEVIDRDLRRLDPEVMVDRGEEIAGTAGALDHILATLVTRTDDAAGLDAAAGSDVGKSAGPVIAAGLEGSGRGARIAGSGAAVKADLRSASEPTGDDDEDALVQTV